VRSSVVINLLPRAIISCIQAYRDLGPREGRIYLKLHVLRALGMWRDRWWELPAEVRFVLFVCHGNIIRSPMAAALLRKYLPERDHSTICISSAGLDANPEGGADPRALMVAREFGISLDDHRPQRLTPTLVEQAGVILVMDYRNEAQLLARYPEARYKVFLLGTLAEHPPLPQVEIIDPYNGDTTEIRRCYEILQSRIRSLAEVL
jgi:protein-tyrosine-phosphatase